MADFQVWAGLVLTVGMSSAALDPILDGYLSHLYFRGEGVATARYVLFAVIWFCVLPSRDPAVLTLSKQTLKGYGKKNPDVSRDPGPKEALALIAEWLYEQKGIEGALMAAAFLLQFDLYARPSEAISIKRSHVFPPRRGQGGPRRGHWCVVVCPSSETPTTKIGKQDDTIEVGVVPDRAWLRDVLAAV